MGPGCVCVCVCERECESHFQNSLVVQWLGRCTFTAKGLSSILNRGKLRSYNLCGVLKKKKHKQTRMETIKQQKLPFPTAIK